MGGADLRPRGEAVPGDMEDSDSSGEMAPNSVENPTDHEWWNVFETQEGNREEVELEEQDQERDEDETMDDSGELMPVLSFFRG